MPVTTTWIDFALDRAHDAGWHVQWGASITLSEHAFGPRLPRRQHWIRVADGHGDVCEEHTGASLEAAAFALARSVWVPSDDLPTAA
jgi:hypothetical protein